MKKVLCVCLAAILLVTGLAFAASAVETKEGSIRCPGLENESDVYYNTIKGQTVTAIAVKENGKEITVPKGGHVEWTALFVTGKVTLKPTHNGTRCEIKGVRAGCVYLAADVYDANGNLLYVCPMIFNVQNKGFLKKADDVLKMHAIANQIVFYSVEKPIAIVGDLLDRPDLTMKALIFLLGVKI